MAWAKNTKSAAGAETAQPPKPRMQNLNRPSTSGKNFFLFSKSKSRCRRPVSARLAKRWRVVASDAMPEGTTSPTRPCGATSRAASSVKTAYVFVSPRPARG